MKADSNLSIVNKSVLDAVSDKKVWYLKDLMLWDLQTSTTFSSGLVQSYIFYFIIVKNYSLVIYPVSFISNLRKKF